jgi:Ca2+-binding RTX toxin-like protein
MAAVIGTDKNDWLAGTGNADWIKGYGGDDTLKGGGGADTLEGGDGIDTALYADSSAGVSVSLASGKGFGGTAQGDRLYGIENLYGSSYSDDLSGNGVANALYGLGGNDWLVGHGGGDTLDGGNGEDALFGGVGADHLDGGPGQDEASYQSSAAGVIVKLVIGQGFGGEAEGDRLVSIENLTGSSFDDVLMGNSADNQFIGGPGADTLYGLEGADYLDGSDGPDQLFGGAGDDVFAGRDGDDLLNGGPGIDLMYGGPGADTFVWTIAEDTGVTRSSADIVYDFNFAEGDRVYLGAIDADAYTHGDQAFRFIGTAAFSGTPGELRYYHSGGSTYIELQTGTSPDVEGVIRLDGIHTPEASWFVL